MSNTSSVEYLILQRFGEFYLNLDDDDDFVKDIDKRTLCGVSLLSIGIVVLSAGVIYGERTMINVGICGIFIGVVVLSLSSPGYIKKEAFDAVVSPYQKTLNDIIRNLNLKNAVYIPPYQNLPEGGMFLPAQEEFDIDLAKLDEEAVFLTDAGIGMVIRPLGAELLKMCEKDLEGEITGLEMVEGCTATLKALELADSIRVDEEGNEIKVNIDVRMKGCSDMCKSVACPVCSCILLSISKATGELIAVKEFHHEDGRVEITVEKIGGVEEWM